MNGSTRTLQSHGNGVEAIVPYKTVQACVLILAMVVGVFENVLICAAVLRSRRLRQPAYILLFDLCLIDLFAAFLCLPLPLAVILSGRWPLDALVCGLSGWFQVALFLQYLTNLLMMVVDRFLAARFPILYHNYASLGGGRTPRKKCLMWTCYFLVASWVASFSMAAVVWSSDVRVSFDSLRLICLPSMIKQSEETVAIFGNVLLATYASVYVLGYFAVWLIELSGVIGCRFRLSLPVSDQSARQKRIRRHSRRLLVCSSAGTALYLLIWLPFVTCFGWIDSPSQVGVIFTTWLQYCAVCINPLAFAYTNKSVRRAAVDLLSRLTPLLGLKNPDDIQLVDLKRSTSPFLPPSMRRRVRKRLSETTMAEVDFRTRQTGSTQARQVPAVSTNGTSRRRHVSAPL